VPAAGSESVVVEFPLSKEAKVLDLIMAYRHRGHLLAHLDPLSDAPPASHPMLDLGSFGLTESDLDSRFRAARLLGFPDSPLRDILSFLKETYCGSVGVEYMHMQDKDALVWLQQAMESTRNKAQLDGDEKKRILRKLSEAELFENYIHTRYIAQKRFSVEGGDAVIPALDTLINEASALGVSDLVVGMAHRGRLNVLTNIFGKNYASVFAEFEGNYAKTAGEGDVKYHMGYSADVTTTAGASMHLSLMPNPSHLEFVSPVVEGVARAKQTIKKDVQRNKVLPVLIHGDAAFAGQGVVYETLQLSKLRAYATGGTMHIVINNQVGFTTDPSDARSTPYATDVAKMLESPVFHVNGDDVEAVVHVIKLATRFVQRFQRDVFIDLICYRKYGHNEGDEPSFTQPLMYGKIKNHATPRAIYASKLTQGGTLTGSDVTALNDEIMATLTAAHNEAKGGRSAEPMSEFLGEWKGLKRPADGDLWAPVKTQISESTFKEVGQVLGRAPEGVAPHPKLQRLLETRGKMATDGAGIDWGMGEMLAYGSLMAEGVRIRLTGQDCERGTFSHRHAIINDVNTGQKTNVLGAWSGAKAGFEVINSNLSEMAVLGFEYGYSLADPKALVIWEAQFGDFSNGAQVIIDQFIAAGESKWNRSSGLVMLLPHGYEGQGPEHSSARLERFLQLCGRNNMQICNLSTPAQIFHALRRQVKRDFRMPLVVMSPKSLLRHPEAVSTMADFVKGGFQEVIAETESLEVSKVKRVVLCSGKVYYDLRAERKKSGRTDVALVRVEQLYPWPKARIQEELAKYKKATDLVWAQEEPRNMGAWRPLLEHLHDTVPATMKLSYAGREVAAAPACGSPKQHAKEQAALVAQALGLALG
jgi:2-oxoglutarate dehydrogenase E1 component